MLLSMKKPQARRAPEASSPRTVGSLQRPDAGGACTCWSCFLAFADDEPAITGALFVEGEVGWLGAAATRPKFRLRGAQNGRLAARIRAAADRTTPHRRADRRRSPASLQL